MNVQMLIDFLEKDIRDWEEVAVFCDDIYSLKDDATKRAAKLETARSTVRGRVEERKALVAELKKEFGPTIQ